MMSKRKENRKQLDPIVRFILEHAEDAATCRKLEVYAELGTDTIRRWHYVPPDHNGPGINVIRRTLKVLGYDLVVVKQGE